MRSVALHQLPLPKETPVVWRAEVLPNDVTQSLPNEEYTVNMTIILSDPMFNGDFTYTLKFNKEVVSAPIQGTAQNGRILHNFVKVTGSSSANALWELGKGKLHEVRVGDVTESAIVIERFGLRSWGVDEPTGRLTLNGKIVTLHGWNHHTQWPSIDDGISVTASMTESQMDFDLAQMQQAGTNYIRGSHYPQDARWLDRLDELGIAMWSETLGPGVSLANIKDPTFMKYQLQQLDEMLDDAINHAAIMTWGWFNEGPSDKEEACSGYKENSERARQRDPSRFVTWADDKELDSKCLEYATLIAFNNYPAWYNTPGDLTAPAKHWNNMANTVRAMYHQKPFVISETGAGGIFEWSNNSTAGRWTDMYQSEVIGADVDVALHNGNISGITLWHYYDFKGNDGAEKKCGPCEYAPHISPPTCTFVNVTCKRPGGANHKGVVDFWRRKKDSWYVVQKQYTKAASSGAVAPP
jgi:beta-glucuronidase